MAKIYEQDEFDELAAVRTNEGVHSFKKRSRKWLIALLVVIVVAPLVGIGAGYVMSSIRTGASVSESAASTASSDSSADAHEKSDSRADASADWNRFSC